MVPSNGELGIANRRYATNEHKSVVLDPDKLALVKDPHAAMALRLEAAFGLRREEAINFSPSYADRGDSIELKASTTKGGRARVIPVLKDAQRRHEDITGWEPPVAGGPPRSRLTGARARIDRQARTTVARKLGPQLPRGVRVLHRQVKTNARRASPRPRR